VRAKIAERGHGSGIRAVNTTLRILRRDKLMWSERDREGYGEAV
jgi:hypothetical protein